MAAATSTTPASSLEVEEVLTTEPILEELPSPIYGLNGLCIRPFDYDKDLERYQSWLNQRASIVSYGLVRPEANGSAAKTRLHGLVNIPLSEGIHLGIFCKESESSEFELHGEVGVNTSTGSWPEFYGSILIHCLEGPPYFSEVQEIISDYWWKLPRRQTNKQVYAFSLLEDIEGVKRSIELLCLRTTKQQQTYDEQTKPEIPPLFYGFGGCKVLTRSEFSYRRCIRDFYVSTTMPVVEEIPSSFPPSDRLCFRRLMPSDIEAFYSLRSEEEPARLFNINHEDDTMSKELAQQCLDRVSRSSSMILYGVFLKKDSDTEGELIGHGQIDLSDPNSAPMLGYIFKFQHWKKGYGTEFVRSFLKMWWGLPRVQKTVMYKAWYFNYSNEVIDRVEEHVGAFTRTDNAPSNNLLKKVGFQVREPPNIPDERYFSKAKGRFEWEISEINFKEAEGRNSKK